MSDLDRTSFDFRLARGEAPFVPARVALLPREARA